ncbi:hypothetical protein T11_120 [Trichinella zimbabwensis]|uniref:Uncharacterized protein n=1 Tax=Trichinella zimbabwensis TaxID=268475 RepID=A0A0V1GUD7_9BILA|nr:hypothetical protein T11_120 [Trichinella zimbabwensis]
MNSFIAAFSRAAFQKPKMTNQPSEMLFVKVKSKIKLKILRYYQNITFSTINSLSFENAKLQDQNENTGKKQAVNQKIRQNFHLRTRLTLSIPNHYESVLGRKRTSFRSNLNSGMQINNFDQQSSYPLLKQSN